MKFKMDKAGINAYIKQLEKRIMYVEKKSVEYLWTELYNKTPVRTGAARSSWNISVNTPNYYFDKNKTTNQLVIPNYKFTDNLVIATGCPYIHILNNGWSQQAPANFVEMAYINTKNYVNKLQIKDIE